MKVRRDQVTFSIELPEAEFSHLVYCAPLLKSSKDCNVTRDLVEQIAWTWASHTGQTASEVIEAQQAAIKMALSREEKKREEKK